MQIFFFYLFLPLDYVALTLEDGKVPMDNNVVEQSIREYVSTKIKTAEKPYAMDFSAA